MEHFLGRCRVIGGGVGGLAVGARWRRFSDDLTSNVGRVPVTAALQERREHFGFRRTD